MTIQPSNAIKKILPPSLKISISLPLIECIIFIILLFSSAQANSNTQSNQKNSHSVIVRQERSFSALFNRLNVPDNYLDSFLIKNQQFNTLKEGQRINLIFDTHGGIKTICKYTSPSTSVILTKRVKGWYLRDYFTRPATYTLYKYGVIENSLYQSAYSLGLPPSVIMRLASIFSSKIDFNTDIHRGDIFEILYESRSPDNNLDADGDILAARLTIDGKTYTGIHYKRKYGKNQYYSPEGGSLEKAFIRKPVDNSRISSGFSRGRVHPILGTVRPHKGVDFAALRGTPIKATAEGKVLFIGTLNGYGNTIIIRHNEKYKTLYAHMEGFANGLRSRSIVTQNQVIGYVGTSGLSTGPHLHYEFHINDIPVNPLGSEVPYAKESFLRINQADFARKSASLIRQMDKEEGLIIS